jgi:ribonuclease BN (tRNA processing enzyme)
MQGLIGGCLVLLLSGCPSALPAKAPTKPLPPTARTQLVMLGTGNPLPDPDRSGPATAIVVDNVAYLFDAGPGVVRRASAAATKYGIAALEPTHLHHLFVTHLHSDHTLGYPDLIFTPWVVGRDLPLEVYGPPGIAAMTEHLRAAYAEDVAVRTEGLEHNDRAPTIPNVHEITAGLIFQDARVKITAFAVHHGSWTHAFGYRIEGPDRTIVITGDYAPSDAIVTACNGCDILVSEGYPSRILEREPARREYMRTFHTSAVELGVLATRARAKHVVVTHRRSGVSEKVLIDEIHRGYAGPVTLANDLDRI